LAVRFLGVSLDWVNQGVFISAAGREPGGVVFEVYPVG
jgi:hypothetical protein